ncbi:hypothetical protein MMC17_008979, partial [Xylographa soralifera]|nr:hypothetical protein [Xylographa soralifera]
PLEELFRHRPLTETLKRLAVLAVRFERCYMGEAEMDWKSRFRTDTTFFESLTCISSQSLANPITVSDKQAFSRLGLHDFVDYYQNRTVPNHLNQLNVQWNEL